MVNTNSTAVGQWLSNKLSGQPNQPLTEPALTFARKMLPMLGVTTMPDATYATTTMANTSPDETTLTGRAESRMRYEGTKQQQNLEDISFNALPFINENAKPDDVDNDWLANFYDKGRIVSNEEMQKLWSHILASEVNKPGTFSARTVNLLASLNKNEALLFKRLCTYNWIDTDPDEHIDCISVITPEMVDDSKLYRLSIADYYHLQDAGLIIYSDDHDVQFSIGNENNTDMVLEYHERRFKIQSVDTEGKLSTKINQLGMGQIKLSSSGRELARICEPVSNHDYVEVVLKHWKEQGFHITEL